MSMFWGLPMSVAAEPTLAAQASARRYGFGFRPRRAQPSTRTGATARQTISFASSAESAPAIGDEKREERRGRSLDLGEAPDEPRVEAAHAELRRDDHEAEEERDRRHVDDGRELAAP